MDVADLNGDGIPDLILRFVDGSIGVWYMGGPQGTTITGFAFVAGPIQGWKPVGITDLNGDGHPDLVIQNTDGTMGVWYLGGAQGNQIQGFAPISGPIAGSLVPTGVSAARTDEGYHFIEVRAYLGPCVASAQV